jgi:ABC-type polysaccharide/polyol phosphate transport system ATPase subunit
MSSDVVLKVSNIGKRYEIYQSPHHRLFQTLFRGRKQFYREFWALRDVSFGVKRGECVGIIGRNGSGKSTLLQNIAGTLAPTTGEIEVTGRVSALLELGSGFSPEFTGRENVYMNGAILGLSKAQMNKKFDEIAAFADIGEFIEQPVKIYSSGMYVRLAFAIAINIDPDILIIDEALAVGDIYFQAKCMDRIRNIIQKGCSTLFVSHNMDTIKSLCNRAIYLENGTIAQVGEPDDVVNFYHSSITKKEIGEYQPDTMKDDSGSNEPKEKHFPVKVGGGNAEKIPKDVRVVQSVSPGSAAACAPYADRKNVSQKFIINPRFDKFSDENRYGDYKVLIRNVQLLNKNEEEVDTVNFLDKVILRYHIEFNIQTDEYNIGFLCRNINGINVFGARTNELIEKIPLKNKGDRAIVDFVFINQLDNGIYTISAAVTNRKKILLPDYHDWINNAVVFKSEAPPVTIWGLFYQKMESVSIL